MRRLVLGSVLGCLLAFSVAGQALAFDCFIANKPVGAGSVGTQTSDGGFVPNKPNPGSEEQPHGAFVSFEEGGETYDVFIHGLLPPVREGGPQADCDGKGIDLLEACFGGEHAE